SDPATSPANRLPSAAAMNHIPIICPIRPGGASFVMDERPTGESASSPTVNRKYVTTSHAIETRFVADAYDAPHASTNIPAARPSSPSANFTGMDGFRSRRASHVHSVPNTGASTLTKNGLTFGR